MAERVGEGDIDDAITVTVDIELDDVDKVVGASEHVAQTLSGCVNRRT